MLRNYEKLCANIGARMLENGAEIFRVEDTAKRILEYSGAKDINIFCISSVIIIKTERRCEIKRIKKSDINLFEIEKMNALSRSICKGEKMQPMKNEYPLFIQILSVFIALFSFCLYFGGNIRDALFSGLIGNIVYFKKQFVKTYFSRIFLDCFLAGALAILPSLFITALNFDKIMIGVIMLFVPGLTITNSVRDIMLSDTISGIIELFEAVFTALAIALGLAVFSVVLR